MEGVVITSHNVGGNKAMFLRCGREAISALRDHCAGEGR